ncbi:serine hydroxymethyltransferase [Mycoplasmopsis anatis]|uniref:serine hydroxymethyltransferase n=1 Tax=Mycoplasmopsis anatis TaxID=171279 RepID=UPI001C4DE715|nr:serine hydroxymethyltransferase [Mycoplasmopsis anatis]MBW0594759.1 serine hydroxymethyltransferase [Mycoplasmopsis anatis]MBW0595435.1 serine hydroxymethyltransferase [Mycoplasmopsis anatis]MBW0598336.1 serine hydroxymethyltransferase [Mycoplasmopsis anatis]MBW0601298.1 serine hydroxymethyltransferase [Mycoplasmopsis anatis]MBW0602022.1 serine hydroxymethyltransferase [Mycoplasmopsis anatis]
MYQKIKLNDIDVQNAINNELIRQENHIELIASENYASENVLKAQGSVLTNKYGEGYPGKRYYGSCENVDIIESLAIERLKKLFNVQYANVQPYSGSVANAAAIASVVPSGGKIMGLSLDCGGHLTHGYKISFSGIFYNAVSYKLDKNGLLDYDEILKQAQIEKPDLIIAGYSAYPRIIDFAKFREICDKVGAKLMVDIAHIAGLIVAGVHPSPVGYADIITSTTHKTLRGARGGIIMTNDPEIAKKVDRWVFPGYQGGPLFHAIAGKAVGFYEALQSGFKTYGENIVKNSKRFAQYFINKGVKVVSNGTDNHLFMIDVNSSYNITGRDAEVILEKFNITINKNSIPFDTLSPTLASGIRLGTAAMTSRDFDRWEELAEIIDYILSNYNLITNNDPSVLSEVDQIKEKVKEFTTDYPIKKHYF